MTTDAPRQPERPSRVLVVDDNAQNLELLVEYLQSMGGLQTATATDGLEALEVVRIFQPDLIVLDIMMPRMSGFEVCQKLKADPETRDIPILMVTALNEMGDIERAVEAGTDDFLSKPVNRLELLTRVRTLLKLRHVTDRLERTLAYLQELESARQPQ